MLRFLRISLFIALVIGAIYGLGRLYFYLTGGFTLANIHADFLFEPKEGETSGQNEIAYLYRLKQVEKALDQPYYWLGKGCQSYVFASADQQYVIKFIKYQRFRTPSWLEPFAFIPPIQDYLIHKKAEKKQRLDTLFRSWKLAHDKLSSETGVLYVHLHKTEHVMPALTIYDKMGFEHRVDLNQVEFMLQTKAEMLCAVLERYIANGHEIDAKKLIDELFYMILAEYHRGLADNDHALMQNTGVYRGHPVHIDVGQFIQNSMMKDPAVYQQELYNKMYKFHAWLQEVSPSLAAHLEMLLKEEIGVNYPTMKPYVHLGDVAKIPNE